MVSITEGIIHLVTAGFGALGFSLIFNVRRELLPAAAFGGLLDWGVYMMAEWFFGNGVFLPSVVAAAFASIYAEAMARVEKSPATVFYIPALIPLIPGGSLYYTMSYAVLGQWDQVQSYGASTAYCALGIAVGMSLVLSVEFTFRKLTAR
ncbi:MAG: threonine/serine exporter family protein, partial [Oscillibacter sp.]|nr:threonine/serine exporter family protein [Oscillibacter sp.]